MASSKEIFGIVNENGTAVVGSGFTSSRLGTGQYAINISSGTFSEPPAVLLTVDTSTESSTYTAVASLHNVTVDSFNVSIQNLNGNSKDFRFNFLCIGE